MRSEAEQPASPGDGEVVLWRWLDPEQPYDRHRDDWQTSRPPAEPGHNDYEIRTFRPVSPSEVELREAVEEAVGRLLAADAETNWGDDFEAEVRSVADDLRAALRNRERPTAGWVRE